LSTKDKPIVSSSYLIMLNNMTMLLNLICHQD